MNSAGDGLSDSTGCEISLCPDCCNIKDDSDRMGQVRSARRSASQQIQHGDSCGSND